MPPPETSWPVCLKDGMQSERSKTNIIVGRSSNVTCINLFPLIFHAQLTLSTKIIIDIHGLFSAREKGKLVCPYMNSDQYRFQILLFRIDVLMLF